MRVKAGVAPLFILLGLTLPVWSAGQVQQGLPLQQLQLGAPPAPRSESSLNLGLTPGTDSSLFRQPPTLSNPLTVGRQTLIPYFGLGFSQGATSDVNGRVLQDSAQRNTLQDDRSLRDLFGKSMMPSEVQLGIRLPF